MGVKTDFRSVSGSRSVPGARQGALSLRRMEEARRILPALVLVLLCLVLGPSALAGSAAAQFNPTPGLALRQAAAEGGLKALSWRVVRELPHDPASFTQGLVYDPVAKVFYESAGRYGLSDVRVVAADTGEILMRQPGPSQYFYEGLARIDDRLFLLTWREKTGFVLDRATLTPQATFAYDSEGWGLTWDGKSLILSDGSDALRFLDPATFQEVWRVRVRAAGHPVPWLNELEYVPGKDGGAGAVWANVWMTDYIVRIDPRTGEIGAFLDMTGILPASLKRGGDVLNGIAYDPATGHLFVTGKLWPRLYEIEILE